MLEFLDHEKVSEVPNMELLLVIMIIVANHTITWFLLDGGSSCNVLYTDTLEQLRLHKLDLSPSKGGSILTFNDFVTCPCGMTDLSLFPGEWESERKVNLYFLVVSCKGTFIGILGRSFMPNLNVVASLMHLKIVYHNNVKKLITIHAELKAASRIPRERSGELIGSTLICKKNELDQLRCISCC